MSRSQRASDWMANLPFVLLGIRSSTRDDSAISPAHLVFGRPLRLPGEFFPSPATAPVPTSAFVAQLQLCMRDMSPFPVEFHAPDRPVSVPKCLSSCPAVFVRIDAVKRPLTPPYLGPYELVDRNEKTFVLLKNQKPWTVTIDRLKPYFPPVMSAPPHFSSSSPSLTSPPPSPSPSSSSAPPSPTPAPMSRFGRQLRPPDRYSP